MTKQPWAVYGIILVLLIPGIGVGNHFLVKPGMVGVLPEVPKVQALTPAQKLGASDLYAASMAEIKSGRSDLIPRGGPGVRNPFLWPLEKALGNAGKPVKKVKVPVGGKAGSTPQFELSMIIVGDQSRLALINNHFVSQGSRIMGYEVKAIAPGSVLLVGTSGKQQRLSLAPGGILQKKGAAHADKGEKNAPAQVYKDPMEQVLHSYLNPNVEIIK